MQIDENEYERIANEIHSDTSPVGIDAKKTHILILGMLDRMQKQLDAIEKRLSE